MRRFLASFALPILLLAVAPAHAAGATQCQLSLDAAFAPGLSGTTAGLSQLRLSGTLSNCVGTASAPSAVVTAGQIETDPETGFQWQEPVGSVNGTCINNASNAITINRWSDGSLSITQYTSNSFTYGIQMNGSNIASVQLTAVNKKPGQPNTLTLTATRDVGTTMAGFTGAFDPSNPQSGSDSFSACNGDGLTSTQLNGLETVAG